MDISNRTLGLLLVAAIVVSLGGTFVSLSKLDDFSATGFATENASGIVNLTIGNTLSIILSESNIDFGTCVLNISDTFYVFDSSGTATSRNNTQCDGTYPDNMTILNEGNVNANVSVATDTTAVTWFGADNGAVGGEWMAFKGENIDGCANGLQNTYLNFTGTGFGSKIVICQNLTFGASSNTMRSFAMVGLNSSSTTSYGTGVTWTFYAEQAGN